MNVESLSSAWKGTLSCEECSTRLTVFRKKKICHFCKSSFCHVCIIRREDKKLCCRKCQILTARPLDRNKLLNLRSRDLINYLTSRQIPTNGCVEKEDLVNVLIKAVNNSCFHSSSTSCHDGGTNSYPNSPRNASNSATQLSQSTDNLLNDGIRITGHDLADTEDSGDQSSHFNRMGFNQMENVSSISGQRADRLSHDGEEYAGENPRTSNQTPTFPSELEASAQDGHEYSLGKPLMLSDIKSRSDLDALSIKQLKELLMRNRTDFKGCVEKAELVQKADRLWSDYIVSRKDIENLSLEELCKICMDAPIECVLLECGHMATCTSCGKQLCECPICRQFVVRCVRTFKA